MGMTVPVEVVKGKIYLIRGQKVLLDADLAQLYGVETANLNKAVKRNIGRFPEDFMFQLTAEEAGSLIFQIGISKPVRGRKPWWSQIVTTSPRSSSRRCSHAPVSAGFHAPPQRRGVCGLEFFKVTICDLKARAGDALGGGELSEVAPEFSLGSGWAGFSLTGQGR
jgi:hypothetical protein